MALWNDKRTPKGIITDSSSGVSARLPASIRPGGAPTRQPVSDADHAVLDTAWNKSFADLKTAGVAHDADHPVAAAYRNASNAVNHANRSRDYGIATGQIKSPKPAPVQNRTAAPNKSPVGKVPVDKPTNAAVRKGAVAVRKR